MKRTQKSKDTGKNQLHSLYGWQQFCPECRATNTMAHKDGCELKFKIYISPTARFPTKNASEKIWKRFYDKFLKREWKYICDNRERLINLHKEKPFNHLHIH